MAFSQVRVMRGLSMLLSMLMYVLAGLLNIIALYLIVLCIYALLAMQLFGRVHHGVYITDQANFCTLPTALLTLFRCATGEDWNGIMRDAMAAESDGGGCSEANGDCGSAWAAVPFFVSYQILGEFLVLKMAIALINESYAAALVEAWARALAAPDARR